MSRTFVLILSAIAVANTAFAQSTSTDATRLKLRKEIEHTAADPSLRSIIGTPSVDFSAELAKDKKTATVKVGLALSEALTTDFGFTGAFSEDDDRSPIASVRGLGTGSKGWIGLTYKKYRLSQDLAALQTICWQAAWAAGQSLFEFNCADKSLPNTSFAAEFAAATPHSSARLICQRFNRVINPMPAPAAIDCDSPNMNDLLAADLKSRGPIASESLRARAIKPGAPLLDLCNENRRALGAAPSTETCKVADLPDKSWLEQFEAAVKGGSVEAQRIDICNRYLAARGQTPTGTGSCDATGKTDPIFTQSFQERYAAAYHWGVTPVLAVRYKANRSKFAYLDDSLSPIDPAPQHYSSDVVFEGGVLTSKGLLVTAGYRHSDAWKAKPTVSVCQPIAGTDGSQCSPGVLKAPTEKKENVFELQAKRFFTAKVAAQVVASIAGDKTWHVEVPIYFIPDKDSKGLTGGIVAGYESSDKRWNISVFVGSRFTLFAQ